MAEAEKNEEVKAPSNFIHDFIDEDLAEGKYSKIQTRFLLSQTDIFISVMLRQFASISV